MNWTEASHSASDAAAGVAAGGSGGRVVESSTPNGCLRVRVRASPLRGPVASALDGQAEALRGLLLGGGGGGGGAAAAGASTGALRDKLREIAAGEDGSASMSTLQARQGAVRHD